MIKIKIFQKHFLIILGTIVIFLAIGKFINDQIMRSVMLPPGLPPPVSFAKLIDQYREGGSRLESFQAVFKAMSDDKRMNLTLLDDNGQVLAGTPLREKINWAEIDKPDHPFQFRHIRSGGSGSFPSHEGPPPEPGIPILIKFPQNEANPRPQYLYSEFNHGPAQNLQLLTFISLVICLLLGVGTAVYLIYRSVAQTAESADHVITELQKGNLKARFKIKKNDEIGRAMQRFNKMADEIERLVEQMKSVERSRVTLLQELAHDLRTPIASLKNLLEILQKKDSAMDVALRSEMMTLSLKEVDYFERLVEDLLFLAQVSDPHYHADVQTVQVDELLENTIRDIETAGSYPKIRFQLEKGVSRAQLSILGDAHLLHRLFRNGLENAASFAKSKVRVVIQASPAEGYLEFLILDDGTGFTTESLRSFGERRVTRKYNKQEGARVSVGLGSVIMKTVCHTHRGTLSARNAISNNGTIQGAEVKIELPIKD